MHNEAYNHVSETPGQRPVWRSRRLLWFIHCALLITHFTVTHGAFAQPGTWQTHFSYRSARSVAVLGSGVYAATRNGLYRFDKSTSEIRLLTRDNGLSDVGVNQLLALPDQQRLMLVYRSGNIDFLAVAPDGTPGEVLNVNTIVASSRIQPAFRGINHINRQGNIAYLSTDFGVVVFDLVRNEIRDTYFSPTTGGTPGPVLMTAILGDSLYALTRPNQFASTTAIRAVRLASTVNLADPANWRLSPAPEAGQLTRLVAEANRLLVSTAGRGGAIFARPVGGLWSSVASSSGPAGVFAGPTGASTFVLNAAGSPALTVPGTGALTSPLLQAPAEVVANGNRVWVADTTSGLLDLRAPNLATRITPEGPFADTFADVFAYPNGVVALTGDKELSTGLRVGQPPADYYEVPTGRWQANPAVGVGQPFNAAAYLPGEGQLFLGGYGAGLWTQTETRAPARVNLPTSVNPAISALATDAEGNLWIGTGQGTASLHVRRPDGRFESFGQLRSLPIVQIVPDDYGSLWLRLSYGVMLAFNPKTGQQRYFSSAPGDGNLPGNTVTALTRDRSGFIWVGTERGVTVFDDPAGAFTGNVSANAPIFERRRLLATEAITAMTVDGGNYKWVATASALYRFGPDGTTLDVRFTPADSPLPSADINALAVEPVSGRVFISSSGGLVSFGGLATEPAEALTGITIFPNPVRPDYTGLVSIRGLTDNAVVKILDAGGILTYETRSQGGTATWDLADYRGRPAQTGIYLVVVIGANGQQGIAGKVAVVR
ncbi:transcriptional regulator [Rudanella paleaurantiibacter]|uniref:Transcriptional regulator n=1 Tax=Rudanella paleaurantiibacter TaxID=2614655 RepID=A0A7J5TZG7_9BACT|nr:two-component regulator propeller domain-containing protein [Rudanella paleaurantiibacter]KAB7730529.1 transcriptional regulator [Rudanella paleaurantiibacter]